MQSFLAESLGLDEWSFHFIILPLLIFIARVVDVSIDTLRIIYMLHGKALISTVLGFFEALVWILAITQIFQNLTNWATYIAYAMGFASGVYIGMIIEEKLAIGRVVVQVITHRSAKKLTDFLAAGNYRYSNVDAFSNEGPVSILFTVVKRENLENLINVIKQFNEHAFYTVEGVRRVSDDDIMDERGFLFRKFSKSDIQT